MKIFWIFACWMTIAECGVVPWSQSKEDEAIHLFKSYCLNADKGETGSVKWFCKKPTKPLPDKTFEHYKVITARPHNQKQVIFVQTPSRTYKHNVYVKGEADFNQDTHIYVVPGQDRHHVDIQGNIETKSGNGGKPHTFYLQNNPFDVGDSKYPDHTHHHHDPYSPAYNPSYSPPSSHDSYPATHDHYPSYTQTSPRFELPPSVLETSTQFQNPQSEEENSQFDFSRPLPEQTSARLEYRQPEPENSRLEYHRQPEPEKTRLEYRQPEPDNSRFEYRQPEPEKARFEYRRHEETSPRFDYRRTQEETSPRYDYHSSRFDSRFPNHIRPRRRHNDIDDDFVTPHPDTVKKFSGFRNF